MSQITELTIDDVDASASILVVDDEIELVQMDGDEKDEQTCVEDHNGSNVVPIPRVGADASASLMMEDEIELVQMDGDERNGDENEEQTCVQDHDGSAVVPVPYVGLEFPNQEAAYEMYNLYSRHKGFGIRKSNTDKSAKRGEIIGRLFVCSKTGGVQESDGKDGRDGKQKKRGRTIRTGCTARMWIHLNQKTELWTVTAFNDIHNHQLTPSSAGKYLSHKKFHHSSVVESLMDSLAEKGLPTSTIAKVANAYGDGEGKTITPQQYPDNLHVWRKNNVGCEFVSIINHFQAKRETDHLFFIAMEVDEGNTLRSVFWADGRSIASYLQFGDIVSFDVSYRTNKSSLPFAPLTGLNHHRQSILFGCALLADGTEGSFVWLFEQLKKCMFGKAPAAIITYQDDAICNAINRVFPDTRHRYCSWHVDKHIRDHLHLLHSNKEFADNFQSWFYSRSIRESESRWEHLKEKYVLKDNTWLMNMYKLRHHWVPAYLSDIFTAGMKSTLRSESINGFFNGYLNAMTPPSEFVMQYENAIVARREAEKDEDFMTDNSEPRYETELAIESQAGKCYTRKMFDIFHVEFSASNSYWREKVRKDGDVIEYLIGKSTGPKDNWRTVVYDPRDGVKLTCSCAKFETEGMLCRHVLCVMRFKMFAAIPDHYILKRWTRDAKYRVGNVGRSAGETEVTPVMMFSLKAKTNEVLQKAFSSIRHYNEINTWLEDKLVNITKEENAV